VRTDSGAGACEVLYIESMDRLGTPNKGWRTAWYAALVTLLLAVVVWVLLPVKFDD
jgi:hypothetical protein